MHAIVVSYVNVSIIKSKSLNCKPLRRVSLLCYIGEALYTSVLPIVVSSARKREHRTYLQQ